jgi:hypothetical protein
MVRHNIGTVRDKTKFSENQNHKTHPRVAPLQNARPRLIGVYLTGMYFTAIHLMSVYLTGVYLSQACIS